MSSERPRWYRRRIVIVLGTLLAVLVSAAAVFALTRPGDVFNRDVEFRAEESPTTVPTPEPEKPGGKKRPRRPLAGFKWPAYGYSTDRRRYLPAEWKVRPPYKKDWGRQFGVLLEFPPIIVGNRLYTVTNSGNVVCLNRTTGKKVWSRDLGYLAASSPAYGDRKIYVTILERSKGGPGRVVALGALKGWMKWSKPLASRTESSPVYEDGRVYFGSEDGTLYSMSGDTGATQWRFHANGAIKGGPALNEGKLYFGTYGGAVYAVGAKTGKQVWRTGTSGANFGLTSGNFYATPAVAYGRVFIGNTDGNMYSFGADEGKLAWRRGTGSYVYASPAVAQVRGMREPAVFFGSYDGTFYALDARSGATRWTYREGGKISGGATVIGDIVYYSNWGQRDTTGLWAKSGEVAWKNSAGAFNPVVSDGQSVYLTGFSSISAYLPKTAAEEKATRERRAKKAAEARAAKKRKAAKRRAAAKRKAAKKREQRRKGG